MYTYVLELIVLELIVLELIVPGVELEYVFDTFCGALVLLFAEHALAAERGTQTDWQQQLFTTHTDVFDAHWPFPIQPSKSEQSTLGAQII